MEPQRIYYIGDVEGYVHPLRPTIVMSFGYAMDVHDEDLADALLRLPHFSANPPVMGPVPVEDEPVPEVWDETPEPEPEEPEAEGEPEE